MTRTGTTLPDPFWRTLTKLVVVFAVLYLMTLAVALLASVVRLVGAPRAARRC